MSDHGRFRIVWSAGRTSTPKWLDALWLRGDWSDKRIFDRVYNSARALRLIRLEERGVDY